MDVADLGLVEEELLVGRHYFARQLFLYRQCVVLLLFLEHVWVQRGDGVKDGRGRFRGGGHPRDGRRRCWEDWEQTR